MRQSPPTAWRNKNCTQQKRQPIVEKISHKSSFGRGNLVLEGAVSLDFQKNSGVSLLTLKHLRINFLYLIAFYALDKLRSMHWIERPLNSSAF